MCEHEDNTRISGGLRCEECGHIFIAGRNMEIVSEPPFSHNPIPDDQVLDCSMYGPIKRSQCWKGSCDQPCQYSHDDTFNL